MILQGLSQVRRLCSAANSINIMKFLNVAEKNDAAKTISGFLSRGRSQRVSHAIHNISDYFTIISFSERDSPNTTRFTSSK